MVILPSQCFLFANSNVIGGRGPRICRRAHAHVHWTIWWLVVTGHLGKVPWSCSASRHFCPLPSSRPTRCNTPLHNLSRLGGKRTQHPIDDHMWSSSSHTYSNTPWEDRLNKGGGSEHGVSATIMPPSPSAVLTDSTVSSQAAFILPHTHFPAFSEALGWYWRIGGNGDTNAILRGGVSGSPAVALTRLPPWAHRARGASAAPPPHCIHWRLIMRTCLFSLLPNPRGYSPCTDLMPNHCYCRTRSP